MTDQRIASRRTIEALRSGVPNRDAVNELGSAQPEIEEQFRRRLAGIGDPAAEHGMLVAGGFGAGKSHVLEYLQHVALNQGFVSSKIVISKETPLYDPVKVFRTAISSASVPGRRGSALVEIASSLDVQSATYDELVKWSSSDEAGLDERFAATLYLYRDLRSAEPEFADRIVRFWSGDPIGVGELKRKLREAGEGATWTLPKISIRDLSLQRFQFAAALMVASGYSGWALFFDEIELIGRYSVLQRAKSYGELVRWVHGLETEPFESIAAVLAITDDFTLQVIEEKNDGENVPARLRLRGDDVLAARAERGMRIIERESTSLETPDSGVLAESYSKLRQIHGSAYAWDAPELDFRPGRTTLSMRQYVRAWITEWDLRRLDPSYQPDIKVEDLAMDYSEDADLETPPEGDVTPTESDDA